MNASEFLSEDNWGKSEIPFIPGLQLSERYYREVVGPLLESHFPSMPHTAGLVGYGSDVLGFDTPMSRDHMWGPRLILFLEEKDFTGLSQAVSDALQCDLPVNFAGYPTNFSNPDSKGMRVMERVDRGPVKHLVFIKTISGFIHQELDIELSARLESCDLLTMPQQKLLGVTSGGLFRDDLGFGRVRAKFASYPEDIWLYLLASQWEKLGQEEAFVGRAGESGDELGSQLIAARLVQDLMRLAFLLERRYAPYSKWFGSAFHRLGVAPWLEPLFAGVLAAKMWRARESGLVEAALLLLERQKDLGITPDLEVKAGPFFDRPFQVLFCNRIAEIVREKIEDPWLKDLPLYGAIDQYCGSTDILESPQAFRRLKALYGTTRPDQGRSTTSSASTGSTSTRP